MHSQRPLFLAPLLLACLLASAGCYRGSERDRADVLAAYTAWQQALAESKSSEALAQMSAEFRRFGPRDHFEAAFAKYGASRYLYDPASGRIGIFRDRAWITPYAWEKHRDVATAFELERDGSAWRLTGKLSPTLD